MFRPNEDGSGFSLEDRIEEEREVVEEVEETAPNGSLNNEKVGIFFMSRLVRLGIILHSTILQHHSYITFPTK